MPTAGPSPAALAVLRHAAMADDDPNGFLATLRRGESVPEPVVGELLQALNALEVEYRNAAAIDRRVAYALHRLAFEGQILHTDAWAGALNAETVNTLRIVQEAVDRILSGEDIRYYPGRILSDRRMTHPHWPADDCRRQPRRRPVRHGHDRPDSVAELQAIVRAAVAAGLAVYPQGGRHGARLRRRPRSPRRGGRDDRLDRVIDYPVADMTITVEAGMTLAAIRTLVGSAGQRLAIEAPHPDRATLGGIFATASTGPRRFGWGRPRDAIIGVGFVTGDGELVRGGGRVVKNVAGYDFPKLLTGSMGTLGIITELTLKVNPRPEASALVRVEFASLARRRGSRRAQRLGHAPGRAGAGRGSTAGRERGRMGPARRPGREPGRGRLAGRPLAAELGRPICRRASDEAAERPGSTSSRTRREATGALGFRASFAPSAALRFLDGIDAERWAVRVHAGNGVVRGGLAPAGDAPEPGREVTPRSGPRRTGWAGR